MKRIVWCFLLCAALFFSVSAASPLAAAESWEPIGPPGGTATDLVLHPRISLWGPRGWSGP